MSPDQDPSQQPDPEQAGFTDYEAMLASTQSGPEANELAEYQLNRFFAPIEDDPAVKAINLEFHHATRGVEDAAELGRARADRNAKLEPIIQERFKQLQEKLQAEGAYDDRSDLIPFDAEKSSAVLFGNCRVPLDELMTSAHIREQIVSAPAIQSIIDTAVRFIDHEYDRRKADLAVHIDLGITKDGRRHWMLTGGIHRTAAALLTGQEAIEGDVTSSRRFMDSPNWQRTRELVKQYQLMDPESMQIRRNLVTARAENIVIQ